MWVDSQIMGQRHRKLKVGRWDRVRRRVLERDGWRCQQCGLAGRLEVDHLVALEDDPGQDPYALAGLQTLCRLCHIAKTSRENRARRPTPPPVARWREMVEELS